jgi:hypothetical protein
MRLRGMSGVQLEWLLTPRRTTGAHNRHRRNRESPECGGRVDPGALARPRGTLLKPRTKRLVMGPVLVCVRADPTATHVLIRYRPTY